jgi:hypothetical protein
MLLLLARTGIRRDRQRGGSAFRPVIIRPHSVPFAIPYNFPDFLGLLGWTCSHPFAIFREAGMGGTMGKKWAGTSKN